MLTFAIVSHVGDQTPAGGASDGATARSQMVAEYAERLRKDGFAIYMMLVAVEPFSVDYSLALAKSRQMPRAGAPKGGGSDEIRGEGGIVSPKTSRQAPSPVISMNGKRLAADAGGVEVGDNTA